MFENPTHGHVTSLCRHCLMTDQMAVSPSMEEANKFMHDLPETFDGMADSLPPEFSKEGDTLRNATFRRYDEDVYRMRVGKHDLIVVSTTCHDPYDECKEAFKRYIMMKAMEARAKEVLGEMFGLKESNQSPEEAFKNMLEKLNLPEDFLGTGPN